MDDVKMIAVRESVFADNDADAEALRTQLRREKTCLINVMGSPGAGKTRLLLALTAGLKETLRIGVMEADIDATVDTEAMLGAGLRAIQIHTGGMCHLDADMTRQGLQTLGTDDLDLVILENVGNLVCPAEFDTGAAVNITVLSVPEGHDKPLKYPLMYEKCALLVVSKADMLPYFDFDCRKLEEYARRRNPHIEILYSSAKTGCGTDAVAEWILRRVREWNREER